MVQVTFIAHDGTQTVIDAKPGHSLMDAAVRNDVTGILGECGGACACATCHVYVDPAWTAATGTPSSSERSMLDYTAEPRPTSRLSCQIQITPALAGLVVQTPASQ